MTDRTVPIDPTLADAPLVFTYRNWRGEVSTRRVQPIAVRFGSTEWHPEAQWLLQAIDIDKGEEREFAMKDIAASPAAPGAEVAEAIHAARGFDPRDKAVSGAGVPYGEWAATLKIAAAVAPFITGPGAEVEPVAYRWRYLYSDGRAYGWAYQAAPLHTPAEGDAFSELETPAIVSEPLYLSPPTTDAIRAQALNDAADYAEGFAVACESMKLRARKENDRQGAAIHGAAEDEALRIAAGLRSNDLMRGLALAGKPGEAE